MPISQDIIIDINSVVGYRTGGNFCQKSKGDCHKHYNPNIIVNKSQQLLIPLKPELLLAFIFSLLSAYCHVNIRTVSFMKIGK
jgi:hypothetical protein